MAFPVGGKPKKAPVCAPNCEASGYLVALRNHVLQRPLDGGKSRRASSGQSTGSPPVHAAVGISGYIKCEEFYGQ